MYLISQECSCYFTKKEIICRHITVSPEWKEMLLNNERTPLSHPLFEIGDWFYDKISARMY